MKRNIAAKSAEEGFPTSRLPTFTPEEIELLKGSSDFLGLNHYTSYECAAATEVIKGPSIAADVGANCIQPPEWESGASAWLKVYPDGFRKVLNWIKDEYGNPEVMVTENGFSYAGDERDINDCRRVYYYNVSTI